MGNGSESESESIFINYGLLTRSIHYIWTCSDYIDRGRSPRSIYFNRSIYNVLAEKKSVIFILHMNIILAKYKFKHIVCLLHFYFYILCLVRHDSIVNACCTFSCLICQNKSAYIYVTEFKIHFFFSKY